MSQQSLDTPLDRVYQMLQKLVGFHGQLLENVRHEKEALVAVDLKRLEEVTAQKENLVQSIRESENERRKAMEHLGLLWKIPGDQMTVQELILRVQGVNLKQADQFRSIAQTLQILIQHVQTLNAQNQSLVQSSLAHVHQMKNNILGEHQPKEQCYTPQAGVRSSHREPRLISKEV
jgi:flagellar biosynthesis/type III secretory pathway chaperone